MIQNGGTQCYGEDGRFGSGVTVLYEDSKGNVWADGMTGLWRWKPGPPKFYGRLFRSLFNASSAVNGGWLSHAHAWRL